MKIQIPNISPYVFPGLRTTLIPATVLKYETIKNFIIQFICENENTTIGALSTRSGKKEMVQARRYVYVFIQRHCPTTFVKCASIFKQDHASVLHSLRTHKNLMDVDIQYREKFDKYQSEIQKFITKNNV